MARIKKIEATLVGGNKYEIIINCNSKGVFSANVPIELSMNVAGLQTKMENPKLDELESLKGIENQLRKAAFSLLNYWEMNKLNCYCLITLK